MLYDGAFYGNPTKKLTRLVKYDNEDTLHQDDFFNVALDNFYKCDITITFPIWGQPIS